MRSILLALPLLILASPALAQEEDSEVWLTGGAGIAVGENSEIDFEAVSRFSDDSGGLYEAEFMGGFTQTVAKGVSIHGGYVRVVSYSRGDVTRGEDRFRVQLGLSGDAGPVRLSGRLRLEHRSASTGDDTAYRFRPQIKASLPLGDSDFSLVASHESLIPLNDTDWGERAGYDRMRNLAGVSWKASDAIGVEIGYLNQYRFGRGTRRDTMDHVLSLSVGLSL
ncbi:DUF2490 domain-containing protein [Sphingomonas suaedae]|uniref:DUF2490 domain-containing protein n=1 Tax=Sphingomonas suaedae TaxID=2599297 RepID=A0A518RGE3_9SPHN|nr:DUF2490 domain-containing protein [Sphingomonas suaedae]QDX26525.1 DUF2490 domain-containing protein [Sphingomonas suaedae]